MITKSKYGPLHALAAGAVLLFVTIGLPVWQQGLEGAWRLFVYGSQAHLNAQALLLSLFCTAFLFGGIAFWCWVSTLFAKKTDQERTPVDYKRAFKLTAYATPFILLIALGLSWIGEHGLNWLFDIETGEQNVVTILTDPNTTLSSRIIIGLAVVFEAPLFEESLFRGVIFRGFAKKWPLWIALALSGFIFACVHINAATFVALWYVGAAFAWLYYRTGTILAPMLAHAAFNSANLLLLFLFPE